MNTKYCMKCGAQNDFDANFCKKCSTAFGLAAAPKQKVSSPIFKAPINPSSTAGDNTADNDEEDEGDGISVDFVPDVDGLSIEILEPDIVKGVTFDSMVAEANRQKGTQQQ